MSTDEYAALLDTPDQLTKRDLINIAKESSAGGDEAPSLDATRKRVFCGLLQKRFASFDGDELVDIWPHLKRLAITTIGMQTAWETAMAKRVNETCLIGLLQIYEKSTATMPAQIFRAWCKSATAVVGRWHAKQVAYSVTALAKLSLRPHDEFLEKWSERFADVNEDMNPTELANVIAGIGDLWIHNTLIESTFATIVAGCATNQISAMKPEQLVATLAGFAAIKFRPDRQKKHFMQLWFEKVGPELRRLSRFGRQVPLDAGWALCRLHVAATDAQFGADWAAALSPLLESYAADALQRALDAAVHLQLNAAETRFTDAWMAVAAKRMHSFDAHAVASMLVRLAKLDAQPNAAFTKSWCAACARGLADLQAKPLVDIIVGAAHFDIALDDYDPHFVDRWAKCLRKFSPALSAVAAERLVDAVDRLNLSGTFDEHLEEQLRQKSAH